MWYRVPEVLRNSFSTSVSLLRLSATPQCPSGEESIEASTRGMCCSVKASVTILTELVEFG